MFIENTEIHGIDSSLRAMRFPMGSTGDNFGDKDKKLSSKLAGCPAGSGHDSFLKGILVKADITADHSWWLQESRYHFIDIVSSSSKMHSISKGSIRDKCHEYVSDTIINIVDELIDLYNNYEDNDMVESHIFHSLGYAQSDIITKEQLFEMIIMNTPIGYELKAQVSTNYLQLKSMYRQRKNHKMSSWNKVFREWVEGLPLSYLIIGE
jgi:hypothetical protein